MGHATTLETPCLGQSTHLMQDFILQLMVEDQENIYPGVLPVIVQKQALPII